MRVGIVRIRQLHWYTPTTISQSGPYTELATPDKGASYFARDPAGDCPSIYPHFPILIDPDGCPWVHGNRYLLARTTEIVLPNYRTLECQAVDLARFREWVLKEDIDFLSAPERKRARPTYRYCKHLQCQVQLQTIQRSTAKRRISTVQSFYRWLMCEGHQFQYPLWVESDFQFFFSDYRGLGSAKKFTTTDLSKSFRAIGSHNSYDDFIEDGGKLKPLTKEQQEMLVVALKEIENTEMTLSFLLALTTGARLQTVFTLRRGNFNQQPREGTTHIRIKVGMGSLVRTKRNKRMVIYIPVWLYTRVQIYLQSERHKRRLRLSSLVYEKTDEQYVFLTKSGEPYYISENDPFFTVFSHPPRGNSVTQFMRQTLKPKLEALNCEVDFTFHDLRASFGMNLLEERLEGMQEVAYQEGTKPGFLKDLLYVKERMGHEKLSTTEKYLRYRENHKLALSAQCEFESYLECLISSQEVTENAIG